MADISSRAFVPSDLLTRVSHVLSPAQVTPVRRLQGIESIGIFEGFGGILNLNLPERTLVLMNANITIYP